MIKFYMGRNFSPLSRSIRAHRYEISVDRSSTLKNYSHFRRRLTDKPDIFLECLDNSEQNQHRCIFNFFLKIFWVGPLYIIIIIIILYCLFEPFPRDSRFRCSRTSRSASGGSVKCTGVPPLEVSVKTSAGLEPTFNHH